MIKKAYDNIKRKPMLLNVISAIILQFSTVAMEFIVSKATIQFFGSNVNGLITSLTQFLSYITLVEGGITGVIIASLYAPLARKDNSKIASIIFTSKKFYNRVSLFFVFYTIILAVSYPFFVKTGFSFNFILLLTFILSISLFTQYAFAITYKALLTADKKSYVAAFAQTFTQILTIVISLISLYLVPNIHLFKLVGAIMFIFQPIVYSVYVNKHYKFKNKNTIEKDKKLIKSRWDGLTMSVASFVHRSSDVIVLTLFSNLAKVSVYGVYSLIASGIRATINMVLNSLMPSVGHAYISGDEREINEKMDIYEFVTMFLVFYLFTVASLLIVPFVMLYTHGVSDANYNQPLFGVLILLSEAVHLIKTPHLNLAYSANKFKEITKPAFFEAIINIILSIILVRQFGLVGVAIGTIIAMLYRLIFHVKFTKTIIKNRHQSIFYKKLSIFCLATLFTLVICWILIPLPKFNIKDWIIHAVMYSVLFFVSYSTVALIFFRKELNFFKEYLLK